MIFFTGFENRCTKGFSKGGWVCKNSRGSGQNSRGAPPRFPGRLA